MKDKTHSPLFNIQKQFYTYNLDARYTITHCDTCINSFSIKQPNINSFALVF